ncbi:MAG: DNA polymerase, partial [Candidatus Aenigmatarchaeota archaeon]
MIRTVVLTRKIPPLKKSKRIIHFFAFDTETYRTTKAIKYLENEKKVLDDSYIHKMRILSYVHIFIEGSNYKVVNERVTSNTEDFVDEILSVFNLRNSPSTIYVFSFNLRFDLLASKILEILSKKGFYVSPGGFYFENAQSFVTMERYNINRQKKQKITFIDLRNYFRVGNLNSIAKEIIGKEKDEIDIMKYVNKENLTKEELETLSKYCLKDSQLVAEIVIFLNENLFKKYAFGLTISSVAFDTYRKYFLKDIYIHKFEKVKEIERQSYYGGRTECFKIGNFNEKVYIYDINSLYPSQYSNLLPSQFVGMFKNISVNELFKLMNEYLVIAKVKVNITENKLPYRMNNKLIFPIGKFTT